MNIRRDTCLLCGIELVPIDQDPHARQLHPEVADCEVTYTDAFGVAIDEIETIPEKPPESEFLIEGDIVVRRYPPVEDILQGVFDTNGLPRLGGLSTGRGWSGFSLWQRCSYAWMKRYIEQTKPQTFGFTENEALSIGILVHTFLALYYCGMMTESPYNTLTVEQVYERVREHANPKIVGESWRLFKAYSLYYMHEEITPLAVEYDLRDPRTGESCRYDLVAFHPEDKPGRLAGTYIYEHKTSQRFDDNTLDGWANDGEVIGQVMLWKRLGLDHRFGPLRGVIVNIIGKQLEPKFHRTIVSPSSYQVSQHLDDLRRHEGLIQLARANKSFPRSRANCINRWGKCEWWDHCATITG